MTIATAIPPARQRAFSLRDGESLIGLSRSTWYRLERDGKIKLIRIGGRVLIPADEIERLLNEGAK
jgi:excisionase family DNA binding protein